MDTSGAGAISFGSLTAAALGGLQGSRSLALTNTAGTGLALSIGANGASTSFSRSLSGSGSLTKVGSGTLTLAGSNTYSGGTTVTAGTLAATNPGACRVTIPPPKSSYRMAAPCKSTPADRAGRSATSPIC